MSRQLYDESGLRFEFPSGTDVERLDIQGVARPEGMKLVDFVVQRDHEVLMIEVKNFRRPPEMLRKPHINKGVVNDELVPKARDSYCYLHLMKRDSKPFRYVVLLEPPEGIDSASLLRFGDDLQDRIAQESDAPWKRQYVREAVIVTLEQWRQLLPEYPVKRT